MKLTRSDRTALGYCKKCQQGYHISYEAWLNEESRCPMTGYSWKPGGWEDQTDMQPVELPEFRDACGHHHLYHEECAEKLRKVPERAPIWVTLYLVDRAYGGPEEGGWWYDTGEVIATWPVPERDLAEDIILMAKHAGYTNEGRRDIGSVLSDGIYEFTVDWEPGQDYPQRTPHYE